MMPGSSTILVRPSSMRSGTFRHRLGDELSTTELLKALLTPDREAERNAERRASDREAREMALEQRARDDARLRQDEILKATEKNLQQVAEVQQGLVVASTMSLKTTLNRAFILGGAVIVAVLASSLSKGRGKRGSGKGRRRSRRSSRASFKSPPLWSPA